MMENSNHSALIVSELFLQTKPVNEAKILKVLKKLEKLSQQPLYHPHLLEELTSAESLLQYLAVTEQQVSFLQKQHIKQHISGDDNNDDEYQQNEDEENAEKRVYKHTSHPPHSSNKHQTKLKAQHYFSSIIYHLSHTEQNKLQMGNMQTLLLTTTRFLLLTNQETIHHNILISIGNLASTNTHKNLCLYIDNLVPILSHHLTSTSTETRKLSARCFANLACSDQQKNVIGKTSSAIDHLIALLVDKSSDVRRYAAMSLGNLSHITYNQMIIMDNQKAILYLLKVIKESYEDARIYAARTLAKLSVNKHIISANFLSSPRPIKLFLKLLTRQIAYPCKRYALIILSSVASNKNTKDIISAMNIVKTIGVFVTYLKHNEVDMRRYAARTLANLSCSHHQCKLLISSTENTIEYLIDLLNDQSLDVQTYASRALANLSSLHDNKIRIGIAQNSIDLLINLLTINDKNIRKNSVWTLANLIKNTDYQISISPKIDVAVSILQEMLHQTHDLNLSSRIKSLLSLYSSPISYVAAEPEIPQ